MSRHSRQGERPRAEATPVDSTCDANVYHGAGGTLRGMLELYQAEGCPHSAEVRDALTDLGLSYVTHNPRRPGGEGGDLLNEVTHAEMTEHGGKDQIPYLVDSRHGVTMYETDDIVEYLQETYG